MSSFCCCRGFLNLFGVSGYPMDEVAAAKLDRAKVNRTNQNGYSSTEKRNGSVVSSEPKTDQSDVSRSSSRVKRRPSIRQSVRSTPMVKRRGRRSAETYDDSDSESSVDSEDDTVAVMKRSIRKSISSQQQKNARVASANSRFQHEEVLPKSPKYPSPVHEQVGETSPAKSPHHLTTEEEMQSQESEQIPTSSRSPNEGTFEVLDEETGTESPTPSSSVYSGPKREFRRKTLRSKTPSPSMGSGLSLESLPKQDWDIGEAESIYAQQRPGSRYSQQSDENEHLRVGAVGRGSSMTETTTDDDDEYGRGSTEPISACGTLDVAVEYSLSEKRLQVTIIEAHDVPNKARGGPSIIQVRAVLLPEKKKKFKTKVQHISSPRFAETLKLTRASPEDLKGLALRLRLYGIGKIKDRLIGEAVILFDELNLIRDPQLTIQLQLEPRQDINRGESDSSLSNNGSRASSMMSLSYGGSPPEILIGLSYSAPTGRLCVEVIKGSHFRNMAMSKPPDTFVKLSLLNSACQEMSQSKTTIRRGQPNPVYKETFFFQVALFQLAEVTLMVSVFSKRTIKKKEMIGWVSMGRNSSSDLDEQHWVEMKDGKGQQVCRWHALIDS